MLTGTIQKIDPRGFGFIDYQGIAYYFHAKNLAGGLKFDTLVLGAPVQFKIVARPFKSPGAANITLIETQAAA